MPTLRYALLPLLLAACTPMPESPSDSSAAPAPPASAAPPPSPAADAALRDYRWTLEAAQDAQGQRIDALFPGGDRALTLAFADGQVAVSGGCNRMGGGYRIASDGALQVAPLRATMMACAEPLMRADRAISALLSKPLRFAVQESMPPRLQLRGEDGSVSTWVGGQTPEARYGSEGERVFLEVAPQRVACDHPLIANHRCLQVREIVYDDEGLKQRTGDWRPLYEEIEGFEFREGARKVLRLKRFTRQPAPADASAIVYVLDMVVESETVER